MAAWTCYTRNLPGFVTLLMSASLCAVLSYPVFGADEELTPAPSPAHPVLVVQISEKALTRWIDREVQRITPIEDCFQGTRIVGKAVTTGRPRIALRDNKDDAAFEIIFSGTTKSRTTGLHHPVTLSGHSDTRFVASKRIVFHPGLGFQALPAVVDVQTTNFLDDICTHRRGIIGRAILKRAWAQAECSKPAALEFARSRAKTRILAAFDTLLEKKLADLNNSVELRYFAEDFFNAALPPIYQTSTQNGYVQLAISSKPGTPVTIELPAFKGERKPIQMWLHSSLLGNDLNIGLSLLQEATKSAQELLTPAAGQKSPLEVLPPTEIAPGVKPPAPAPQKPAQPEQVVWQNLGDWLVLQFEDEQVAKALSKRLSASKAAAQPKSTSPSK